MSIINKKLSEKIYDSVVKMKDRKYTKDDISYVIMRTFNNSGVIKLEMRVDYNNTVNHKTIIIHKYNSILDIENQIIDNLSGWLNGD